MDLPGRKTFVAGGSGDIGGAIAKRLAEAGVDVAASHVGNKEGADSISAEIQSTGRKGVAVQLDRRSPKSIDEAVKTVIGEFGQLDILVNNAAWNIGIPFKDLECLTYPIQWETGL